MNKFFVALLALVLLPQISLAQSSAEPAKEMYPYSNRFSLVAGMTQVILGGYNLEANWHSNRMAFDYSHGWGLEFSGSALTEEQAAQHLAYRIPWTTGFGVGYRVLPFLDIRLEPKLHRYEVFYEDQNLEGTPVTEYTTATLGLGMYYRYYPFRRQSNALSGIVIVPNARFWPNVWSSLDNDEVTYENRITEQPEVHTAAKQGIPGTGGFFVNVSVGYTF